MAFSAEDIVPDSPTNNFCTLNPLTARNCSVSEGNLKFQSVTHNDHDVMSSIAIPTKGIWYFEMCRSEGDLYFAVAPIEWYQANTNNTSERGYIRSALYYGPETSSNWTSSYIQGHGAGDGSTFYYAQSGYNGSINDVHTCCLDFENQLMTVTRANVGVIQAPLNNNIMSYDFVYVGRSVTGGSWPLSSGYFNFGQDPTFGDAKSPPTTTYTDANGIGAFYYQPPTGALALCTANLPDFTPTVNDDTPQEYFKAVTYTGNGTGQSITSVGFQPDLVWIKSRIIANHHQLTDSVRGDNQALASSETYSEYTGQISLNTNGFSVTGSANATNNSSNAYVAWCWKAGGPPDLTSSPTKPFAKNGVQYETLSAANITAGTITPTAMSVNTDAGFSIIQWTGNGLASKTIGHGLDVRPAMIIHKDLDGTDAWLSWHQSLSSGYYIQLSESNQAFNNVDVWPSAGITSSVITTTANATRFNNYNGERHIAYCFAEVEGYSKFGSYTGNGSPDGPFVYCGFRPAFVMVKWTSGGGLTTGSWRIMDTARNLYNPATLDLIANEAVSETTYGNDDLDILSNGFKWRSTGSFHNTSGANYIFMAFSEQPFKFSNAR